jgi:hypothetical protein
MPDDSRGRQLVAAFAAVAIPAAASYNCPNAIGHHARRAAGDPGDHDIPRRCRMRFQALFAAVAVTLCWRSATAVDWPQWRGPDRTGLSTETGLLPEWPSQGPKLLWQVKDIGDGYSTPAVVGDRLYLLANRGIDDEFVQALGAQDGQQVWTVRIGKVGANQGPQYPAARSTPTVDGDVLYALGSDGDLACVAINGGKVRWQKNLRSDFGGQPGNWARFGARRWPKEIRRPTPPRSPSTPAT